MKQEKEENSFLNLTLNIILPTLIMMKGRDYWPEGSPEWANLALGLAFPIGYGIYDFITRRKYNFFSILGFVSVLLTGGFAMSNLEPVWFAVKEAAIPAIFGVVVLGSMFTPYPLVRVFLFNKNVMQVEKVESALLQNNNKEAFDKLLDFCSYLLAGSFFMSAFLNYYLSIYIVKSPAGTPERIEEIEKMFPYSIVVISIPMMLITGFTLYKLISGITKMSGLKLEEIIIQKGK